MKIDEEKKKENRYYRVKAKLKSGKEITENKGRSTIDIFSFEERFGWPEKLSAEDIDEEGLRNLISAIVKSVVDDIMDYEIILLNNGRDMYNDMRKLPEEYIRHKKQIAEKAKYELYRPEFELYLGDLSPDSIMRRIKPEAVRLIRQYKDNKAKKKREEARKKEEKNERNEHKTG